MEPWPVEMAKAQGKEVVGFVGCYAAIIADAVDENGSPNKFAVGCQRPSSRSFWKIPLLNRGESPVKAEDPEVDVMISLRPRQEDSYGDVQQRLPRACGCCAWWWTCNATTPSRAWAT